MLQTLRHFYEAIKTAKAESDALVEEGRRMMGWSTRRRHRRYLGAAASKPATSGV
ncbi:MAG: hypothetical protein MUF49_28160 [Oculatellaceae cyanobacterium Prado106]|jgi:hypothetical protein|nr:hypothetical protein [Oculatellaceae cyanobacterium Prado106]